MSDKGKKKTSTTRPVKKSPSNGNPRFQRLSRKKNKVQVGDRFARMFTDTDFQDEVPSLPTDKYGIKRNDDKLEDTHVSKIYEYNPKAEQDQEENELSADLSSNEGPSDHSTEDQPGDFQWDEESSSTDIEESEPENFEESEEEDISDGEETKRIAIVNMDWDHIRAVDIFHLLRSFLPKDENSIIEKVSIIPSQFGLERMKKESEQGPDGIWNEENSSDSSSEDTIGQLLPMTRKRVIQRDREAFDQEKLRKYQKERLRYYFAVVDCSSKETALHLYQNCNDIDIAHTSNKFDMRFIPDDIDFLPEQVPKEVATTAPIDHVLPEFHTKALQHTRVKLTWDQDDPERLKLTKKLRDDSLYSENLYLPLAEERKLKNYLANSDSESSDDSSDDGEVKTKKAKRKQVRKKYASLLNEIHHSDTHSMFGKESDNSGNMDMEITFTPGLSSSVQDLVEKSMNKNDVKSPWDMFLEKRQEKRKVKKMERKLQIQQKMEADREERDRKKKERKKDKKKRKQGIASDDEIDPELALLVSGPKSKDDKPTSEDEAEVDPRFAGVVTNPKDFGFDRTNPLYKGSSSFVKKVHKKRAEMKTGINPSTPNDNQPDVKSIVAKIRKHKPTKERPAKKRKLHQNQTH